MNLLDVLWRYPRLREPLNHQQVPQMPGIEPIGLGSLLTALQGLGLRWIGQMGLDARPTKLLDHVAPAGGRLHGDGRLLTGEAFGEPFQPGPEVFPIGRLDLAPMYFAGLQLHVVESDLLPVQVETAYNVHSGSPQAPLFTRHGYGLTVPASELGRPHFTTLLPVRLYMSSFPWGSVSKPTLANGHLPLKSSPDNSHQAFKVSGLEVSVLPIQHASGANPSFHKMVRDQALIDMIQRVLVDLGE
jgi:hypothetical protein